MESELSMNLSHDSPEMIATFDEADRQTTGKSISSFARVQSFPRFWGYCMQFPIGFPRTHDEPIALPSSHLISSYRNFPNPPCAYLLTRLLSSCKPQNTPLETPWLLHSSRHSCLYPTSASSSHWYLHNDSDTPLASPCPCLCPASKMCTPTLSFP